MSDSISYALLVITTLTIGIAMQIAWRFFVSFIQMKRLEARYDEVSIAIGHNARNSDNEQLTIGYLKDKFSPSKFENRITDALDLIIYIIHFPISILITAFYFAMVAGRIFEFWNMEPLLLWAPMFLQLTLSIAIYLISITTKVIFGRYPGEARGFNKTYARTIK